MGKIWNALISVLLVVMIAAFAVVAFSMADPTERLRGWISGSGPTVTSGDVALIQIRETTELNAATGTYSVPVIVEPADDGLLSKLPGTLTGDRIVAIYQGEVRAVTNLGGLTEGDLVVDETTKTMTITVPEPVLSDPQIDPDKSQVVVHNRGVLTRLDDALGDSSLDMKDDLDKQAQEALTQAAADSDLKNTGKENTQKFLESLGKTMGYDTVTVEFKPDPS